MQTWKDLEIIVIDDGSTDGTAAAARAVADHRTYVYTQANAGPGAARNYALSKARGNFIQYLDADDLLDRSKVETQLKAAATLPQDTLLGSGWSVFVDDVSTASPQPIPSEDSLSALDWLLAITNGIMMPPHGWLTPRGLIERAGRWDERLSLHDDGEYFTRVALQSSTVTLIREAHVYYRRHGGDSVSKQRDRKASRSFFRVSRSIDRSVTSRDHSRKGATIASRWFAAFLYFSDGRNPRLEAAACARMRALHCTREPVGGAILRLLCRYVGTIRALAIRRAARMICGIRA